MKKIVMSFFTVALLVACGEQNQAPKAIVSDTKSVQSQETNSNLSQTDGITELKVVSNSQNTLKWTGSAIGKSHYGTVDYTGVINLSNNQLTGGELIMDMNTINSEDLEGEWKEKLNNHLKNADFFNVDSFPTAKLVIKGYDGKNVQGSLSIKDITKFISFPATINITENTFEGSADFTINRTDYGIVYGSGSFYDLAKDKIISDDIAFSVSLKASK